MDGTRPLLNRIARDEALVRGLGDAEARLLVEWLVDQAEELLLGETTTAVIEALCRRGRAIARFVFLWCYQEAPGAAGQLAAAERFAWPLPTSQTDPCELMQHILRWERR